MSSATETAKQAPAGTTRYAEALNLGMAHAMEEDPYWIGGVWTRYEPRSFSQFVEPWEMVPVVLDGSRRATLVEGPTAQHDMAQFALIEMRGAGRIAFGMMVARPVTGTAIPVVSGSPAAFILPGSNR